MKKDYLKTYEIVYTPTIEIKQEVINPYDDWDSDNVKGDYFYVSLPNHSREITKSVRVQATTKETAKAIFAVHLYFDTFSIGVKGGFHPIVIDGVRNIKSITEVKSDD